MNAPRISAMRLVPLLAVIFILDLAAQAGIVAREDEANALALQLANRIGRLETAAAARMQYFERGLGWAADDSYGFYDSGVGFFFSRDLFGYDTHDDAGRRIAGVVASEEDGMIWVTSRNYTDGSEITVGYGGTRVETVRWRYTDGVVHEFWGDSLRVYYPDESLHYSIFDIRDQPLLRFSHSLTRLLFAPGPGSDGRSILADLVADAPHHYLTRILASATTAPIDLSDSFAAALYAVNWFRNLLELPDLGFDKRLSAGAENHVAYLVNNGITSSLVGTDTGSIDDFLTLHDEAPDTPGFTGATANDRAKAAGYPYPAGETATMGESEPISEVIAWFHSIFHRRPFLAPEATEYSHARHGFDESSVAVANWGYRPVDTQTSSEGVDKAGGGSEGVIYPRDGEILVPYAWSAVEAPDPFPGNTHGVGPPLTYYSESIPGDARFILRNSLGSEIDLMSTPVLADSTYLEAVPSRPLEPDSRYHLAIESSKGALANATFNTAPISPAEVITGELRSALPQRPVADEAGFDINSAMARNDAKGELIELERDGTKYLGDEKYRYVVPIPTGYSNAERTWEELKLTRGHASIHLYLYLPGPVVDFTEIRQVLEPQLGLESKQSELYESSWVRGERVEYIWEYSDRAIAYYLEFGNYALAIYGYGVDGDDMDSIAAGFVSMGEE